MPRHPRKRHAQVSLCLLVQFLLVSAAPLWAQGKKTQSFVLNPAKPYAYIVFDHAGKRTPLGNGENKYGYWLRLVNNCRLPIAVTVFSRNYPNREVGTVLFDRVVKIQTPRFPGVPVFQPRPSTAEPSIPALTPPRVPPVHSKSSTSKWKNEATGSPGVPAKPSSGCLTPSGEPPEGYSKETASLTDIGPGKSLLFSIPSNQLSPDWYIQVKFNLEVNPESPVEQPDSYVDFDWWRLPKAVRRLCK